jgi:hypothetical protein
MQLRISILPLIESTLRCVIFLAQFIFAHCEAQKGGWGKRRRKERHLSSHSRK